jgi:hypothetical protein
VKDLLTPLIAAVGGECLSEIPVAARRCGFCTAEQPAATA